MHKSFSFHLFKGSSSHYKILPEMGLLTQLGHNKLTMSSKNISAVKVQRHTLNNPIVHLVDVINRYCLSISFVRFTLRHSHMKVQSCFLPPQHHRSTVVLRRHSFHGLSSEDCFTLIHLQGQMLRDACCIAALERLRCK